MKVLLIGSGGREHALTKKISESGILTTLYVAPGNPGTGQLKNVENVDIKAYDIGSLLAFAIEHKIDLTVVGPDDPLAMGIVDVFQNNNLKIFGPSQKAAKIESSKSFAKRLMAAVKVPTAPFVVVSDYEKAVDFAKKFFEETSDMNLVIKADGLALGKGVYICSNLDEATSALNEIMIQKVHGTAGTTVVMENFIGGQEISVHAFCDGTTSVLFPTAQDHKQIFDGDTGPNTGSMGTIAPVPWFNGMDFVSDHIVKPILSGMKRGGHPFIGTLYPGLKISKSGPKVLEFNARFGDPETQVYMMLLETDILQIMNACIDGTLHEIDVQWKPKFAACVILASSGYPGSYKKGFPITGIDKAEEIDGVTIYHAGTTWDGNQLVTNGGRVLGVTAIGDTLQEAVDTAYQAAACINFQGKYHRTDIGKKSLKAMEPV